MPDTAERRSRRLAEIRRLLFRIRMRFHFTFEQTRSYARSIGVEVADDAILFPSVQYGSEPWLISVGSKSWLTAGVEFITHDGSVTVVRNGPYGVEEQEPVNRFGRVAIGDNCFVGVHSLIMPGVTIGDNCIVGAASVVTKDVQAGTVVAGNPARPVSQTERFAQKVRRESLALPEVFASERAKRHEVMSALTARGR